MQREPPATEEGWYALHDVRRIDWDAWREAPDGVRRQALDEGVDFLERHVAVEDAPEGQSAVYTLLGHEGDLMIVHLRPTMADLDAAERRFEGTAFADYTERADSFVSVTEASGYSEKGREYIEGDLEADSGLARYMDARLHPEIPDDEFVCFYPMSKRRRPEQNWYDLPFDERAEHVQRHGEIGREYGGQVQQMITGSMGFDDWEWGVTLWADDMTDVKELLAQMRFDPSTSRFADFGSFHVGRTFPPADLPAVLAGEHVPTDGVESAEERGRDAEESRHQAHAESHHGNGSGGAHAETAHAHPSDAGGGHGHGDGTDRGESDPDHGSDHPDGDSSDHGSGGGRPPAGDQEPTFSVVDDLPQRLAAFGLYEGQDYEAGDFGLVFPADADAEELADEVADLRSNFEHYDRHVLTTVRAQGGQAAAVSIWTARDAAETAAAFLGDLSGISDRVGGPLGESDADADGEGEATGETGDEDAATDDDPAASVREELADLDVYAGQPHGEDVFALVVYSTAGDDELGDALERLREAFADEDEHVKTALYDEREGDVTAVVSLWESDAAADGASDALAAVPEVVGRPDEGEGFGTMGMFYTVQPDYREEFVDTFGVVGEKLSEMDGHRETALLVNREDDADMFIASQWDAKEDAMAFFRSEDFAETVEWGREVLADRPRHVFLA